MKAGKISRLLSRFKFIKVVATGSNANRTIEAILEHQLMKRETLKKKNKAIARYL